MAATAQSLFDTAECFSCLGPVTNFQTLKLGLLLNIAESLGTVMTSQELIDEAECYLCLPGVSQADAIELALLNVIAGTGGGGGGVTAQQVYQGAAADPNGVVTPADITKPALYFPNSGGTLWQFDVPSQTWV